MASEEFSLALTKIFRLGPDEKLVDKDIYIKALKVYKSLGDYAKEFEGYDLKNSDYLAKGKFLKEAGMRLAGL